MKQKSLSREPISHLSGAFDQEISLLGFQKMRLPCCCSSFSLLAPQPASDLLSGSPLLCPHKPSPGTLNTVYVFMTPKFTSPPESTHLNWGPTSHLPPDISMWHLTGFQTQPSKTEFRHLSPPQPAQFAPLLQQMPAYYSQMPSPRLGVTRLLCSLSPHIQTIRKFCWSYRQDPPRISPLLPLLLFLCEPSASLTWIITRAS